MSSSYIIEIGESAVGLVTRETAGDAYRFFASDSRLHVLEGRTFHKLQQVERLARDLIARRTSAAGTARVA